MPSKESQIISLRADEEKASTLLDTLLSKTTRKIGASIAAVVLIPGFLAGCTDKGSEVASQPPVENAYDETPEYAEHYVTDFEIPAGLSTQELADRYVEITSDWTMQGATAEFDEEYSYGTANGSEAQALADRVAAENADYIASQLYSFDSEFQTEDEREYLKQVIENGKGNNAEAIQLWAMTNSTTFDPEPYDRWYEVDDVTEVVLDNGLRQLTITQTGHENLNNRTLELRHPNSSQPDGVTSVVVITFETVGETEKVISTARIS